MILRIGFFAVCAEAAAFVDHSLLAQSRRARRASREQAKVAGRRRWRVVGGRIVELVKGKTGKGTRAAGLFLLGFRFGRTFASPYLRGIARDAEYVASHIAREKRRK